jgi:hypothetical protein
MSAATFGRAVKAVIWGFFGVRRARDLDLDQRHLRPAHVIVAALVVAACFVLGLVALIQWVVSSGVAA